MKNLQANDPQIAELIQKELNRQRTGAEMIASENFVSTSVLEATGSILTNKYAEGYPNKRYYGGNEFIDQIENLAIERVKKLFGAEHANVQAHAGSQANAAAYFAVCNLHDTILGFSLAHGGHLTHGHPVNFSGKSYNFVSYGVDKNTEMIDFDEVQKQAETHKPKIILAGASAYPRLIDFQKFKDIADSVGAYLMVDMAHIAGLVATGLHPDPVPVADIVTSTTHKTLRGPRSGFILSKINDRLRPDDKKNLAQKIDSAVFPGLQGGPLEHVIAAKAVAFQEALSPEFKAYQQQILTNAKVLENKFGVSAAAPVAVAVAAAGPVEEKTAFNVELKEVGTQKIEVIKVVRDVTAKGLKESKDLVDAAAAGTAQLVKEGVKKEEADEIVKKFTTAGAKVEVK